MSHDSSGGNFFLCYANVFFCCWQNANFVYNIFDICREITFCFVGKELHYIANYSYFSSLSITQT